MKKIIASVFAFVAVLTAVGSAHASSNPPVTCSLGFKAKGGGLQVGIGYFKLKGYGEIHCADIHGNTSSRPVRVTLGGHPLAARFAIGYMTVHGITGSFGLNGSIDDLYGQYALVGTEAAIGLGVGGQFSIQNPANGLNISLGLSGVTGLGFEVGLSTFTIEAI